MKDWRALAVGVLKALVVAAIGGGVAFLTVTLLNRLFPPATPNALAPAIVVAVLLFLSSLRSILRNDGGSAGTKRRSPRK
ncbi:hypothetical protein ACYATL_08040 [Actinotignum timonense]|uniref:hypothetical protein n=1 Tax=Actinotignum TaxID=1653174 RepID=UPI00254D4AAF|nr:hypothetical protein [Actinotignum timonense]MDK6905897.1 hypothetical protein [Actinotignum timonense]MDK8782330.1 hypothetical protein [Actinotignum timonense]MDY5138796.1 hypothetical protein [Actinotignum timonense]